MKFRIFYKILILLIICTQQVYAKTPLDKAVEKGNWKKVSKIIKSRVSGIEIPKSGSYNVFEKLISEFKSYDCVLDAEWSRCGAKLLIFPGRETIALRFKTTNGNVEKSFLVLTAKYKTHINILGLRIRIPTINKKELRCIGIQEVREGSMIEGMREICKCDSIMDMKVRHNAKVFFKARILNGPEERVFPDMNFLCREQKVKIEFTAVNRTDSSLRLYWPNSNYYCDPIFRVSLHTSTGVIAEDNKRYTKNDLRVVTLKPNESISSIHYLNNFDFEEMLNEGSTGHFYKQEQLTKLSGIEGEKCSFRIGYKSMNDGVNWYQNPIWKPADSIYVFHLGSFMLLERCTIEDRPITNKKKAPIKLEVKIIDGNGTYKRKHPQDGYWSSIPDLNYLYDYKVKVTKVYKGNVVLGDTILIVNPKDSILINAGLYTVKMNIDESEKEKKNKGDTYICYLQYNGHSELKWYEKKKKVYSLIKHTGAMNVKINWDSYKTKSDL